MDRPRLGLAVAVLLVLGALGASLLLELRPGETSRATVDPAEHAAPEISFDEQQTRVRVEVLNGAGDAGAAAQVTDLLRDAGIDVKTYGNASRFDFERTIVLDRSGRPNAAESVAVTLGDVRIERRLDPELHLDATVILGADWRSLISEDR